MTKVTAATRATTRTGRTDSRPRLIPLFALLAVAILFATTTLASTPSNIPSQVRAAGGATPSPTASGVPAECTPAWEVVYSPTPYEDGQINGLSALSPTDMWAVGGSLPGGSLIGHWDGSSWGVITTTLSYSVSVFFGVAAVAPNDVWAVGSYEPNNQPPYVAATMHWNGTQWTLVSNPGTAAGTYLYGVRAVSANEVWAVGSTDNNAHTLAVRWDGNSWSIISTPDPDPTQSVLRGVSSSGPNDVWAVGYTGQEGSGQTVILHWDGSAWTASTTIFPGALEGVLALGTDDAWAAGMSGQGNQTLLLHWDGTSWTSSASATGKLLGLTAVSSSDIWAIGYYVDQNRQRPLVMHWDGSAWNVVPSPHIISFQGWLNAAAAISSSVLWTAGAAIGDPGPPNPPPTTLTMRYSEDCPGPIECNTGWNLVHVPDPAVDGAMLFGTTAVSTDDVWAVGTSFDLFNEQPLIERWNGAYWSAVPVPAIPGGELYGISATSPNDVWAVGQQYLTSGLKQGVPGPAWLEAQNRLLRSAGSVGSEYRPDLSTAVDTLTLHWDGQSWTRVASPQHDTGGYSLNGVSAVASNDVWAVGASGSDGRYMLHWNGTAWSRVPAITGAGSLRAITAITPNDVWAVGEDDSSPGAYVVHWNGTSWSSVPVPSGAGLELQDISAASTNDVWAVGSSVIHWDGTQWTPVASPYGSGYGVLALAANNAWVATNSHIMHWDGASWTAVASPQPYDTVRRDITHLSAASPNEVWATGFDMWITDAPVIERFVGSCATPSPTATLTAAPTSASTSTPVSCFAGWAQADSPDPYPDYNILTGVAVLSSNNVWAVGMSGRNALTKHWDGTAWSNVSAPAAPAGTLLRAVSAISPDDIWAVGYIGPTASPMGVGSSRQHLLSPQWNNPLVALHWDGQVWNLVTIPTSIYGQPYDVKAFAPNDVWMAGTYEDSYLRTLLLHWDGTSWMQVPSTQGELFGLSGTAPNDLWVVGTTGEESFGASLIMHWDGAQWSTVPSPNPSPTNDVLYDVTAISSNDIWAVGLWSTSLNNDGALAFHWDGSSWTSVAMPPLLLVSVSAASTDDVWAMDLAGRALHWNGSSWTPISLYGVRNESIYGVGSAPGNYAWAVGASTGGINAHTVIENYSDPCQTVTSTPTVANTATRTATHTVSSATPSRTSTATIVPPSGTAAATTPQPTHSAIATSTGTLIPTSTPTVCPIQFVDVPTGSTFYQFVRCLACRGIVSGYPDGTFKPNNNVTRGQLSKIVSNAAGFSDAQPTQMFEDVPVGSTFQVYVGRLASRGYIGGYPCGGPGEPCGQGNLPYFRPAANATRGQISKIVSNAAGFSDPPGAQSFEDVMPGSTFYDYVQRLASRGVMSGYACGGVGEPCGQGNLPYFRPSNDATRGQTAKIVSNTFFPDCQTPARK